jgi:hypothetical protein
MAETWFTKSGPHDILSVLDSEIGPEAGGIEFVGKLGRAYARIAHPAKKVICEKPNRLGPVTAHAQ